MLKRTALTVTLALYAVLASDGCRTPTPEVLDEEAPTARPETETTGRVVARVRGEDVGEVFAGPDGEWRFEDLSFRTALPEGYPAPTPPDAIEIKYYPSIRRAVLDGTGDGQRRRTNVFMTLVDHIESREIAMTAPVEFDFADRDRGSDFDEWSMGFVYRTRELGPTGEAEDGVEVVDTEPGYVLALGTLGNPRQGYVARAFEELEELAETLDGWRPGARRRSFVYNRGLASEGGVSWSEVQLELLPD